MLVSCRYDHGLAEYIFLPEFMWLSYGRAGAQEERKINQCGPQSLAGGLMRVTGNWKPGRTGA